MILTAFLIPHGEKVSVQEQNIRQSSVILLITIILHFGFQTISSKFDVGRFLFEFIGTTFCLYILIIENKPSTEDSDDNDKKAETEQQMQIKLVMRHIERLRTVLTIILTGMISESLHFQPLIVFTFTVVEKMMKKFALSSNYSNYVSWVTALYILAQVSPHCLTARFTSEIGLVSSILILVFNISWTMIRRRVTEPMTDPMHLIWDPVAFWKFLNRYPNFAFAIDRFWSFLLPIPLVLGIWTLSAFNSLIPPQVLGLLVVFASCGIIVQIHWIIARTIAIKVAQLLVTVLVFTILILENGSLDRLYSVFILFSLLAYFWMIDWMYNVVLKMNRKAEKPLMAMESFYSPDDSKIYIDSIQRVWSATSPIISALIVSFLALKTMHGNIRFILLGLAAVTGISVRGAGQKELWALIEVYVLIEQAYLLFLSKTGLPSTLTEIQFSAVKFNILILFIAEFQRLKSIPSMFASSNTSTSSDDQEVQDEPKKSKPLEKESKEIVHDDYFVWRSLTKIGRFISVVSVLALMAVLLFYPQIVDEVSLQTCFYSIWAGIFTFLFYRSDVTVRLRFIFIAILGAASGSFFVYNLYENNIKIPDHLFSVFALHATVFWLSCAALITMEFDNQDEINSSDKDFSDSSELQNSTLSTDSSNSAKAMDTPPMNAASKIFIEAGSVLERLFVLQWIRSCALLAFLAASFNPSIFGVLHLIIGCSLAWKNVLSAGMYVPMILWLLCATFLPAIFYKFVPNIYDDKVKLLVGDRSFYSTICLTVWALILFLQPVFVRSLMKLTTEKERMDGLVSFQILPQDDSSKLCQNNYETFENSARYYLSNWFLEFHDEIMVAVLVVATVSRKNLYGIIYAFLTLIHVIVPYFGNGRSLNLVARISFTVQLCCFIMEYCFAIANRYFNYKVLGSNYSLFLFIGLSESEVTFKFIMKSVVVGMYVILTVRWYLTSRYYQKLDEPTRRFDTHWCRMCNQVSFKSMHSYSTVKQNIHMYLGWASHGFLFMTAISAYNQPTAPSIFLLMLALVFFFYGEASILMPKLRSQIFIVLTIIIGWTVLDSLISLFALINGGNSSNSTKTILCYLGLTNILKYSNGKAAVEEGLLIFVSNQSRIILGITVFLILLQTRLYRSKAWPFVLARLYHSYATAAKKAGLFRQNLQATINFQQRNLDRASENVKKQIDSMQSLDISDWKRLCYVPPEVPAEGDELNAKMPVYGQEEPEKELPPDENENSMHLNHHRNTVENALHLHLHDSETQENDHLERINDESATDLRTLSLKSKSVNNSKESILTNYSDETLKKKMEANFYFYTLISVLRSIVRYLLSASQDYRRLQSRPSRKSSMRIIFHHQNKIYRIQCLFQLVCDLFNSNFDYILDCLILDAQVAHSSGFSFLMVIGVLLVGRLQRPFTSKKLHNRLLILCAVWITFNFCYVVFWKDLMREISQTSRYAPAKKIISDVFDSINIDNDKLNALGKSLFRRIVGTHIVGSISKVTYRPTLIILALSYKRSLMRQLGLWDYGKGIEMARIYYQTEEDLDEIGEINLTDNEKEVNNNTVYDDDGDAGDDDSVMYSEAESSDDKDNVHLDIEPEGSIVSDGSNVPYFTSWKELFWPTVQMPWRDFYVPMFISDFICLFLMMYNWGNFTLGIKKTTKGQSSFFDEMINQNIIPSSLVNMVLLSTFVLVLDRAMYVSKNHLGKFLLQMATLIGYHAYMFFYLPRFYTESDISDVFGIKLWYFCKWIYWISSALQLKYNYPPLRTETFLGTQYGIVSGNLHTFYRSIPFLEEIKTIIDWAMTPSALGLWPWLKFADVFERLYAVQCARAFQGTYYGRHQFGVPFNQFSKIMQGALFITLSVLILWSPFLILSWSSMTTANTVKSFKLEIGIENQGPAFLTLTQSALEAINPELDQYKDLRSANGINPFELDPDFFTKVSLPEIPQTSWNISEDARKETIKLLKDFKKEARIQFNWTITRERSQAVPIIYGSSSKTLSPEQRVQLARMFSMDISDDKKFDFSGFKFEGMFPKILKAPLTEISTKLEEYTVPIELSRVCPITITNLDEKGPSKEDKNKVNVKGRFRSIIRREFFKKQTKTSKQIPHKLPEKECQFYLSTSFGPVNLYIYSSKLPKYNFSSFNLVGMYATVVLTMAQLLKMMHSDMTTRIQYDDLPNPLPILVMCQQMLMMRELGDFNSEESIYWQLIEILRNPITLIEMTKK